MKGYLLLEDGDCFVGELFGFRGATVGEVVFSTGMTGYVESLTDPSFAGQILTFTYPLLGNYGVPKPQLLSRNLYQNQESPRIWVKGVIVSEYSKKPSHHQLWQDFDSWLSKQQIPGLAGIDTRALTIKLREKGVMKGRITVKKQRIKRFTLPTDLVPMVSIKRPIFYSAGYSKSKHIALIDCGVKHGILRQLLKNGHKVTRVPYNFNPLNLSQKVDAVVISNGPGDPKDCKETVFNIRKVLKMGIPLLGVCLGHQLLALAVGADTYKMKYGHRGLNQPCLDQESQKAYMTSQNHGYAVNLISLPKEFKEWFVNLNDGTNEGIINRRINVMSTQFHPEGNPGPFDTDWVFGMLRRF